MYIDQRAKAESVRKHVDVIVSVRLDAIEATSIGGVSERYCSRTSRTSGLLGTAVSHW